MKYSEVVFIKVPVKISKSHRRFFERHVRKMFIKYLAYTNQFDGVLTEQEIEQAKLGYLPSDLDVHHIFPIAGTESEDVNAFMNLSVIHKTTHRKINKEIFAPQLQEIDRIPEGSRVLIKIPLFDAVDAEGIIKARSQIRVKKRQEKPLLFFHKKISKSFYIENAVRLLILNLFLI